MIETLALPAISAPLKPIKRFNVLGDEVELLLSVEQTGGSCMVITQTSLPGGGPPPHVHQHEDEFFEVLEGEYSFLVGEEWRTLRAGEMLFARRGIPHTFNNRSNAPARVRCIAFPGKFQHYLEQLSPMRAPEDMPEILALSEKFGIRFL